MTEQLSAATLAFVVATAFAGCAGDDMGTSSASVEDNQSTQNHEGEATAHPDQGPHGGHLIELGDEAFHAELLHDEATHTVVVHVLDAAGTQEVAIDQSEITLQIFKDGQFAKYALLAAGEAMPASTFSLMDQDLCELLHAEELRGRLNVTIEGESYNGVIELHADDHDECDH